MTDSKIVYFDGVCAVCNRTMDFLLTIDKKKCLSFAPLQGESAQEHLSEATLKDFDSLVYWDNGDIYFRSTAVLYILRDIGGFWSLFSVGLILPSGFRDAIYNYIAKNRYRWFGKRETCRVPTAEERARFLD